MHILILLSSIFTFIFFVLASPCPSKGGIEVVIPDHDGPYPTMQSVHDTLIKCQSSITSLDLRVSLIGCSEWPDRWNFPFDINSVAGKEYPALTSLKLEGYELDEREYETVMRAYDGGWIPRQATILEKAKMYLSTPVHRRNQTNLESWMKAMDWTKLKSLELVDGLTEQVANLLAPTLLSLESVHLSSGWSCAQECDSPATDTSTPTSTNHSTCRVETFLMNLPETTRLTNISWTGSKSIDELARVLDRHGPSLEHLDLHMSEPWHEHVALTSQTAAMMQGKLPRVKHLSISIDRNGTWPVEIFTTLVKALPSLETLDVWLELSSDLFRGADDRGPYDDYRRTEVEEAYRLPRLNESSATMLFDLMNAERKGGEKLRRVEFRIGDWTRSWDGPIYSPPWLEHRRGLVVCEIHDDVTGNHSCRHEVKQEHGWQHGHMYAADSGTHGPYSFEVVDD